MATKELTQDIESCNDNDWLSGARCIPSRVASTRQLGHTVRFHKTCGPCCWYWEFADGSKQYHFHAGINDDIAAHNGRGEEARSLHGAGPCPTCGNPYTNGEFVPSEVIKTVE